MATRLQKKLAEEIVKDVKAKRPRTAGKLLETVGYAVSTSEAYPGKILEQKGVKEALGELGFDEDSAKKVVASILHDERVKPHDRLDAADKVFKVHGSYAPDKHVNVNVEIEASPEVRALAEKLNEIQREKSE